MTESLISEALTRAIHQQIAHEVNNAHTYLHICGYLRNKGLDNVAKHFESQHSEEIEHSKEFFNLLTDLNAPVIIPEIDEVDNVYSNIMDVAKMYLQRELLTTNSINEIKKLSMLEDNPVVEEKMRDMISKQQKELKESTSFMDIAEIMPEFWQIRLWDGSL